MFARKIFLLFVFIILGSTSFLVHSGSLGVEYDYAIIGTEPEDLEGYRLSLWYQPEKYIWSYVKLFFDTSFGHWSVDEIPPNRRGNRMLNIYSFAPVARFYYKGDKISPFIDMSIGLSYLSETYMGTRNLGMHFSFQDQLAFGAIVGKEQRLAVSLGGLHYSNASLCKRNSGMTIPLLINVGLRL